MPFVLDASTALAWHFEDEFSARAEEASIRSYADTVVVPQHWFLEVTSGLLKGERRSRTKSAFSARFVERLQTLEPEVDLIESQGVFNLLLPLARAHRLSVYDAAYLELAERRGLPLATLDEALAQAAHTAGLDIIGGAGAAE